jgi:hypothetical protein
LAVELIDINAIMYYSEQPLKMACNGENRHSLPFNRTPRPLTRVFEQESSKLNRKGLEPALDRVARRLSGNGGVI